MRERTEVDEVLTIIHEVCENIPFNKVLGLVDCRRHRRLYGGLTAGPNPTL
jgi:hypothetical protein